MASIVPKEAIDWFAAKRLQPSFDYRDVWRNEHALMLTVAKSAGFDILADVANAVRDALEKGQTFTQFQQQLTPVLQRKGWWGVRELTDPLTGEVKSLQLGSPRRLQVIFDANLRSARAAGQWDRIQRTKKSHPYLIYELGPSEHHRPQHASWAGTLLPVDHPWWNTHFTPNGYGCKCHIRQVSKPEAEDLIAAGKAGTQPPPTKMVEWVNKRTGEVEQVPDGIDPGWDTNPGAAREIALNAAAAQSAARLHAAVNTAIPAGTLWPTGTGGVFSTVKNVTQSGVEEVLSRVPGITERLKQVQQFIANKNIKAVFVTEQQMKARNQAAQKIETQVGDFLGKSWAHSPINAFTTSYPAKTSGFTFMESGSHVVVKVTSTTDTRTMSPEALHKGVEAAIAAFQSGKPLWSIRAAADKGTDATLATFCHELGHQVHAAAGKPKKPREVASLTRYGGDPKQGGAEWFAEHFAAWLLNREALAAWQPSIATRFDQLMNSAITATDRSQP